MTVCIILCSKSFKEYVFHDLSYVLKCKQSKCFSILAYKALRATVTFFSSCFQSSFSDRKFIPSQLNLFIKGYFFLLFLFIFIFFVILCISFFISSRLVMTVLFLQDLSQLLQCIEKVLLLKGLLLLFYILSN